MGKILIAYDTVSNSTKMAAEIIYTQISQLENYETELRHFKEVQDLDKYHIVIIGSPMRFKNFNQNIRNFIKENIKILSCKKVFCFLTCLYLIEAQDSTNFKFPVFIDPSFHATSRPYKKNNIMDRTHSDIQYLKTILKNSMQPKGVAFFKGRLNLESLGFISRVFMTMIINLTKKQQIGDFLNYESVMKWSDSLKEIIKTYQLHKI